MRIPVRIVEEINNPKYLVEPLDFRSLFDMRVWDKNSPVVINGVKFSWISKVNEN